MRFITGLKNLSKKTILMIIVLLFIIAWFLFILSHLFITSNVFRFVVVYFIGFLAGFTFVLLVLSLIFDIDKRKKVLVLIAIILTVPLVYLFSVIQILHFLFPFCLFANLVLTAFFAFKFCIDTSTTLDDWLYKKKSSRKFTRILEFILFLLLSVFLVIFTIRFFKSSSNPGIQNLANVFLILVLIDMILFAFVLFRFIFIQKFSAYISLFYLLAFIYMLYVVISLLADVIFLNSIGYNFFSFFIDLFLFLYIIGSIFERVEYIKDKIKILGADTIALFVILMKTVVQINRIQMDLGIIPVVDIIDQLLYELQVLLFFFAIFTLLIGLYTIFAHKEGKSSKK